MSRTVEQIEALSWIARQRDPKAITLPTRGVAQFRPAVVGSMPQVYALPSFSKYRVKKGRDLKIPAAEIEADGNRAKSQGPDQQSLLPGEQSPDWDLCLPGP